MNRQQRIVNILTQALEPLVMRVTDESYMHHVPQGAETHFKVVLVTEQFIGLAKLARHRLINTLLLKEMDEGLHALSMHLFTPDEWKLTDEKKFTSPPCRDGFDS